MLRMILLLALAAGVQCVYHPQAVCHGTGQYRLIGGRNYEKYTCSRGDDVWVPQ